MKHLDRIQTFVKVAEAKSFTQVARSQGISTAAISKQIQIFESELGVKLFERNTRSVTLTESGKILFEKCKNLVNEINQVFSFASKLNKEPAGPLKVVSSRYFGEKFILPFLNTFLAQYPKISLDLELAERFPDMFMENVDLIFGVSIRGSDQLIQKRISSTRYVIAGSAEYFKKNGLPRKPKDLQKLRYITHSMRKPDDVIPFKGGLEIQVSPFLRLNDAQSMIHCAVAGMGVIRVHDYVAKESLETGKLVEVLKEYGEPFQPVFLYYKEDQYLHPKIRCFIDFFLKNS